jgi:RNA recognition motif-containing protein
MNLFVRNLSFHTTDDGLKKAFSEYGEVTSAKMALDRETGRPRGFGFVEMPNREQAETAMRMLDGQMLDGRVIMVVESKPRPKFRRNERWGGARRGPRTTQW